MKLLDEQIYGSHTNGFFQLIDPSLPQIALRKNEITGRDIFRRLNF